MFVGIVKLSEQIGHFYRIPEAAHIGRNHKQRKFGRLTGCEHIAVPFRSFGKILQFQCGSAQI